MEIINLNSSNMNSPKGILKEKPEIYVNGTQTQTFSNKSLPSQQKIKDESNELEQKRLYEELVIFLFSIIEKLVRQTKATFIKKLNAKLPRKVFLTSSILIT